MNGASALANAFWGRSLVSVEWRKLCFVIYSVDPALLSAHLPHGVALDMLDGRAVMTLALWEAHYPTVFGVELPSHPLSTEIALRYLVREGARRGTVTIREDSSSPFAALAARALFREPTRHSVTRSTIHEDTGALRCSYEVERGGRLHQVRVRAATTAKQAGRDSLEYLVSQRPYGYQRSSRGELLRYDLDHPNWDSYPILESQVDFDFAALYGNEWGFLSSSTPTAVVLVEGSTVRASLPE
jgi:uncharacterized protein YqjF (DUF2071 family)